MGMDITGRTNGLMYIFGVEAESLADWFW